MIITHSFTQCTMAFLAFFLSNEVLQWGWSISRHACWMEKHVEFIACKNINFTMTFIAGIMSSVLSTLLGVWLIISWVKGWCNFIPDAITVCGVQLALIHHFAILARCTELPVELWPLPSRFISKHVVQPIISRYAKL